MGADDLPLRGVKVLVLSHMIMGPITGMVLADLGAEVIKVAPLEGDNTRRLKGSGIGYFPVFNRNKQSLAVDLKSADGHAVVRRLALQADMLPTDLPGGGHIDAAALPIEFDGMKAGKRHDPQPSAPTRAACCARSATTKPGRGHAGRGHGARLRRCPSTNRKKETSTCIAAP